jgi:nucleoside-diphosphate-sugar epimerase
MPALWMDFDDELGCRLDPAPFRNASILLTGGTGFFGIWLVHVLCALSARQDLGLRLTLVSRSPAAFCAKHPELARNDAISCITGDVRTFAYPDAAYDYVIHAAASASAALNRDDPLAMYDTIVSGTRHVLDFLRERPARMLLVSSGAVYGRQPPDLYGFPETYPGSPDHLSPGGAYAEGKRTAEHLCAAYADLYGLEIPIARPFAFLGPYLPMDRHFAAGNFLADALAGRTIEVQGDGSPYRSYMYPTDLVVWLLTLLTRGRSCRAYNVGSDRAVSIRELADVIASAAGGLSVRVARQPDPDVAPARYVPDIDRAREELGLSLDVDLAQAVSRTLKAYQLYEHEDHICL